MVKLKQLKSTNSFRESEQIIEAIRIYVPHLFVYWGVFAVVFVSLVVVVFCCFCLFTPNRFHLSIFMFANKWINKLYLENALYK